MNETVEQRLERIEHRNLRVEANKAWETSKTRVLTIALMTYCVTAFVFWFMGNERFLVDPLVPTTGFILSIQTLPFVKRLWIRRYF